MGDVEIIRELEHQDHIWYFTGYMREGSAPDMRLGIRTTIRPKRVDVMMVAEADRPPHVEKVVVSGRRVLVGGKISQVESRREYDQAQWKDTDNVPEWLSEYVNGLRPVSVSVIGEDGG